MPTHALCRIGVHADCTCVSVVTQAWCSRTLCTPGQSSRPSSPSQTQQGATQSSMPSQRGAGQTPTPLSRRVTQVALARLLPATFSPPSHSTMHHGPAQLCRRVAAAWLLLVAPHARQSCWHSACEILDLVAPSMTTRQQLLSVSEAWRSQTSAA